MCIGTLIFFNLIFDFYFFCGRSEESGPVTLRRSIVFPPLALCVCLPSSSSTALSKVLIDQSRDGFIFDRRSVVGEVLSVALTT